jgi:hypothetical protein
VIDETSAAPKNSAKLGKSLFELPTKSSTVQEYEEREGMVWAAYIKGQKAEYEHGLNNLGEAEGAQEDQRSSGKESNEEVLPDEESHAFKENGRMSYQDGFDDGLQIAFNE